MSKLISVMPITFKPFTDTTSYIKKYIFCSNQCQKYLDFDCQRVVSNSLLIKTCCLETNISTSVAWVFMKFYTTCQSICLCKRPLNKRPYKICHIYLHMIIGTQGPEHIHSKRFCSKDKRIIFCLKMIRVSGIWVVKHLMCIHVRCDEVAIVNFTINGSQVILLLCPFDW
jgi:hypothetical protein